MTESIVVDTSLEALLDARISCRAYEDRQVPREVIEEILRLAQKTPSWCNTQPWQVAITEGEGTERFRAGLGEYVMANAQESDFEFPRAYQGIYKSRRFDCAMALYSSVGIEHGDRAGSAAQTMKNFELFGAPHVAIITTDEALHLRRSRLRVVREQLPARGPESGGRHHPAGGARGQLQVHSRAFRYRRHSQGCLRDLVRIPRRDHPVNGFRTERETVDNVVQWMSN